MTAFVREVCLACMRCFDGDAKRIQHFVKVLQYATLIAEGEALPADEEEVLQVAAVLHDIGIPNSEKKYGCADGRYQQIEGVPVARELLAGLGADDTLIERVCHMIGLHHSYSKIGDDVLLRMLVESDMLVNAYEEEVPKESLAHFATNIVRTATGRALFSVIYGV